MVHAVQTALRNAEELVKKARRHADTPGLSIWVEDNNAAERLIDTATNKVQLAEETVQMHVNQKQAEQRAKDAVARDLQFWEDRHALVGRQAESLGIAGVPEMSAAIFAAEDELSVARSAVAEGATFVPLNQVADRVIHEEQMLKTQQQLQQMRLAEVASVSSDLLPRLEAMLEEIEAKVFAAGNPVPLLVEPDLTAARTVVRELVNFATYADKFALPPPDTSEALAVVCRADNSADFHINAVATARQELLSSKDRVQVFCSIRKLCWL